LRIIRPETRLTGSLLNQEIHQFISEKEATGALPPGAGIAVSVIQGHDVLYQGTFGLRDRERNLPVTTETLFSVSSVTKNFTAAALMMAQEEGRLDLNAPINSSRTILPLKDPEVSRQVSVADILSHRTGVPIHDVLWYFGPDRTELLVKSLRHLDLIPQGFRKTFVYNNLMYGCLSVVFNEAMGESWESFVTRKILAPMGIKNSGDDVALPYSGTRAITRKEAPAIAPCNGLRTNIEGMTKWMDLHLNWGESSPGVRLMSRDSAEAMQSRQIPVEQVSPLIMQGLEWLLEDVAYGYGWFIGKAHGARVAFHTGISDGYSLVMVLLPEHRLGLTVLTNLNVSPIPGQMIQRLVDLHFGKAAPIAKPEQAAQPLASEVAQKVAPASRSIPDIEGVYQDPAYGTIEAMKTSLGVVLKYNGYEWPLSLHGEDDATVMMTALANPLPIPAKLETKEGRVESILIPLSFDPRVAPQRFARA